MEQFRKTRIHTGFVIDEFGVMQGVVTFHDILESIVGELPLEQSTTPDSAPQGKDGSWIIDGATQIDEWAEMLGMRDLKESETGAYNTLGGFMMHHLGHIPKAGDSFVFRGHTFETVEMDGKRVEKVMVKKLAEEEEQED
jgi:putative hemolysin